MEFTVDKREDQMLKYCVLQVPQIARLSARTRSPNTDVALQGDLVKLRYVKRNREFMLLNRSHGIYKVFSIHVGLFTPTQ